MDIGAGIGAFAAAFNDRFDPGVLAVEPSAAMRDRILRTPTRCLREMRAPYRCQMNRQTPHGSSLVDGDQILTP